MALVAARLKVGRPRVFHCDLDDWDFDARYTEGVCPICGWAPEGAGQAVPAWVVAARRVQWDFVGLVVLAALFLVLGVLVAQAAHILGR